MIALPPPDTDDVDRPLLVTGQGEHAIRDDREVMILAGMLWLVACAAVTIGLLAWAIGRGNHPSTIDSRGASPSVVPPAIGESARRTGSPIAPTTVTTTGQEP
jgi:hypothetical protein